MRSTKTPTKAYTRNNANHTARPMASGQGRRCKPETHKSRAHVLYIFPTHCGQSAKLQGLRHFSSPLHKDFSLPVASPGCFPHCGCQYEASAAVPAEPAPPAGNDVTMDEGHLAAMHTLPTAFSLAAAELSEFNPHQLRAEISRLEVVLQNWSASSLPSLRKQAEEAQQAVEKELTSRRSPG